MHASRVSALPFRGTGQPRFALHQACPPWPWYSASRTSTAVPECCLRHAGSVLVRELACWASSRMAATSRHLLDGAAVGSQPPQISPVNLQ